MPIEVPERLAGHVQVRTLDASAPNITPSQSFRIQIDTAGDLEEMLPWLDSLNLTRLRIEPLGLRAVYDSVHSNTHKTENTDD